MRFGGIDGCDGASEMVERVARAIDAEISDCPDEFTIRRAARAAIAAMREPTGAMRVAHYANLRPSGDEDPEEHWAAMIDAALAEP